MLKLIEENTSICRRVLKICCCYTVFLFAHNINFYIPFEYTVTETFFFLLGCIFYIS